MVPLLLICLGSILLCVVVLVLRRSLFRMELKAYEKYIPLATAPSVQELRKTCAYDNVSACSENSRRHTRSFFKGYGAPSWYEIDKYRIEERIGSMVYMYNCNRIEKEDCPRSHGNMRSDVYYTVETGRAGAVRNGMKWYERTEGESACRRTMSEVSNNYFSEKDYDRLRKWGYREKTTSVGDLTQYVLYCLEVFERDGLPCLLMTRGDGTFYVSDDTEGRDGVWIRGFLSYPLRGISMDEAYNFRNRLLLVDGIDADDFVRYYSWQAAEMVYHGIDPYFKLNVDENFEAVSGWGHLSEAEYYNRRFNEAHKSLSSLRGPSWTKKDTGVCLGLVKGMDKSALPKEMQIDWDGSEFISEKKAHLIPNFDVMRIRVTPFTFDGVISLRNYLKTGCPVYEFSMYGTRAWPLYVNRSLESFTRTRGRSCMEQLDECEFDNLYAVKVDDRVLDKYKTKKKSKK